MSPAYFYIYSLYKKWLIYKWTFILCLCLNIFGALTATVISIYFWTTESHQVKVLENITQNLQKADELLFRLEKQQENSKKRLSKNSDPQYWIDFVISWQNLEVLLNQLHEKNIDLSRWKTASLIHESDANYHSLLNDLKQKTIEKRTELYSQWLDVRKNSFQSQPLLLTVVSLTLFFGVALPLLLIRWISQQILSVKSQIESAAHTIAKDWMKTWKSYGEEPYKNIEFWLQLALVITSYGRLFSRHLAWGLTSDLAQLIRIEYEKIKKATPNP